MKKYTVLFLLVTAGAMQAQAILNFTRNKETSLQFTKTASADEFLNYSEVNGTPYYNQEFSIAKAACCSEKTPMRYDEYADQIEYQKDGTVYILEKGQPYSKIEFLDSKLTLVLGTFDDKPEYFIELADGKNSLLKKVSKKIETVAGKKVIFEKKPTTSTVFKENLPKYFIKTDKDVYQLIRSKSDILDLYPEKSTELRAFINSNKIKFSKEEDLVKVVNFINKS